ncbi:multidrug transporter subunit MdtN [Pusillimonas sp. DMV24BSW_D]|uniref:multidrug transporter subunit MdtN n=1 Tax=Neopusillimonas aestuarii TaxID=2716226 RepID=UPI00140D63D2|nr:multidrug transporter subunit MdtN [Pusillimonas sp. DMV24BSW_D]QIM47828.1 multidrug transporter subunit MdtN [Pusillimonas sp. DMV24BSW_D]
MADAHHFSNRRLAVLLAVVVILAAMVAGAVYWRYLDRNLMSEDAVLEADVVHISAAVPGKITELNVAEGGRVSKGDVLFRLDPEAYRLRVQQAEAELAAAQAALATRERQIRAETANASVADEQIGRAQANLDLARKTVERLTPLAKKGYVTQQDLDAARTAQRDAQVSLSQAQSQSTAARELIGELEAAQATVDVAQASLALARKALDDTVVKAPHDGLVVGLKVMTGERLAPDQALFTLIDANEWFATALFRETDLAHLKAGQCAQAYALSDPAREIKGKVVSIGWGVASEDLVSLPRSLPYVQKSLNWVRVAQRFPVRILLQDPPADLMRVGASASVVVRTDREC